MISLFNCSNIFQMLSKFFFPLLSICHFTYWCKGTLAKACPIITPPPTKLVTQCLYSRYQVLCNTSELTFRFWSLALFSAYFSHITMQVCYLWFLSITSTLLHSLLWRVISSLWNTQINMHSHSKDQNKCLLTYFRQIFWWEIDYWRSPISGSCFFSEHKEK